MGYGYVAVYDVKSLEIVETASKVCGKLRKAEGQTGKQAVVQAGKFMEFVRAVLEHCRQRTVTLRP